MTLRHSPLARASLALLAVPVIAAGCGGSDKKSSSGSSQDARALLEKAFANKVKSADVKLQAKADISGASQLNGPLTLTLTGPYKSNGSKAVPNLDWKISAEGAGQKFTGGLIFTSSDAYVSFRGQAYQAGPQIFAQIKKSVATSAGTNQQTTLRQFGIDPAKWLDNAKVQDGPSVGGDSTRKVTGDVNVRAMVKDVVKASKSPALRRQLQSSGQQVPAAPNVSDAQIKKIENAVKDASVEVDVDSANLVRRLSAQVRFEAPKGSSSSVKGGTVSFDYELTKVGINPTIQAPSNAKPLSQLLGGLGALGGASGLSQPTQ